MKKRPAKPKGNGGVPKQYVVRAARGNTLARVRKAVATNPKNIGPKLGVAAYTANIPPKMIALVMGATEPTIFRWYFGHVAPISIFKTRAVKLIKVLELAVAAQELPIEDTRERVAARFEEVIRKYVKRASAPA